ncbi:hypothetical protein AAZX31_04G129200 [Glycine max]
MGSWHFLPFGLLFSLLWVLLEVCRRRSCSFCFYCQRRLHTKKRERESRLMVVPMIFLVCHTDCVYKCLEV